MPQQSPINAFAEAISLALDEVGKAVSSLLTAPAVCLHKCTLPELTGVYAFLIDGQIAYIGEARGGGGLYDRVLRKHVSGDEGHALQRHFMIAFPDRSERRNHILNSVKVKWVVVKPELTSLVERTAIFLLRPTLNRR